MKTTLIIDDDLMVRLKIEAARQRRTMSDMVEHALRRFLAPLSEGGGLPPLPTFRSEMLVDPADREALYAAMEKPS